MEIQPNGITATIHLENIRHNFHVIQKHTNADICAVIKDNAYGHGAVPVAKVLLEVGAKVLAVATADEGVELRKAGITTPIIVLSRAMSVQTIIEYDLSPAIFDYHAAEILNEQAREMGKIVKIHIKINTGMTRLGFDCEKSSAIREVQSISKMSNMKIEGIFSHFSAADAKDEKDFTQYQIKQFKQICESVNLDIPIKHICNSAGTFEYPEAHFDMVRCGIALYGYSPDSVSNYGLKPVMELKTKVLQVRDVAEGESISYGRTYKTGFPSKIAVISAGYGDGYNRKLSNNGYVLIAGKKAPIVGRICMDVCMVDISDIDDVYPGCDAVLIGQSGDEVITADMMANQIGTISYEVLTSVNSRVKRVYTDGRQSK